VTVRSDDREAPAVISRRQLLIDGAVGLGAVAILGTGFAACGDDDEDAGSAASNGDKASAPAKVRVAYTASAFPSIVNARAGLLYYGKEFNLDVGMGDLQTFNDSATATQALFSGQADVLSGSFLSDLLVIQQGNPLKVLVSVSNGNDLLLVGRDGISTLEQVTGDDAIVATDSPGGLLNLVYNAIFVANDMQVNVEDLPNAKPYGDSPPRTASFITGQTNVCIVHETDMPKIEAEVDDVATIATLWEDVTGMIFEVMAASEEWIEQNPEVAQNVVAAVLKGNREIARDFELYKKAVNEFIPDSGLGDDDIRPIWELAREYEFWPYNGGIDEEAVQFTQEVGNISGSLEGTVAYEDAVNRVPLDAALEEIGEVTVADITG
jgi:ABC-type nitrate/sulfonate/bicarbonate transport system substrate-binding protein